MDAGVIIPAAGKKTLTKFTNSVKIDELYELWSDSNPA